MQTDERKTANENAQQFNNENDEQINENIKLENDRSKGLSSRDKKAKNRKTPKKKECSYFSKSLFKQSCKASGTMWCIITFAVCFMLACVMLISGGSNITTTKNAIQNTIIKDELTSQIKDHSINYYYMSATALERFDRSYSTAYNEKKDSPEAQAVYDKVIADGKPGFVAELAKSKYVMEEAYKVGFATIEEHINDLIKDTGYTLEDIIPEMIKFAAGQEFNEDCFDAIEKAGVILIVFNPQVELGSFLFDDYYKEKEGESFVKENHHYDLISLPVDFESTNPEDVKKVKERRAYRNEYAISNSSIVLAGNLIEDVSINIVLQALSSYGVTREQYDEFGFSSYDNVKNIGMSALIDFKANYDYRMANIKEGETEESILKELTADISGSLLSSLPPQVSEALEEIGQLDLFGVLVGSIFFKMAGLLLPIIYLIMTANSLIAGQVDSGSMAYILSSSIKRRTVVTTQALFLVGSLLAMFMCTSLTSVICLACIEVDTVLNYGRILLLNLGAFLVLFAMSGICFMTSCWFNRSKRSMGIGGGLNMFFLVATMLGLFGSEILPSIVRMDALNSFNYVSIISFFDVVSILDGTFNFIWKLGILVVIGIVCYVIGSEKFNRKDLPL